MWRCNKLFQLLWPVWPDHKVLPTQHKQWSHHHCVCPPTEPVTKAEVETGKDRTEDCHDALFKTLGQQVYSFPNGNPGVKCDHIETDHHVHTFPHFIYFIVGGWSTGRHMEWWWDHQHQHGGLTGGRPDHTSHKPFCWLCSMIWLKRHKKVKQLYHLGVFTRHTTDHLDWTIQRPSLLRYRHSENWWFTGLHSVPNTHSQTMGLQPFL